MTASNGPKAKTYLQSEQLEKLDDEPNDNLSECDDKETAIGNLRATQWKSLYLASCEQKVSHRLKLSQDQGQARTYVSSFDLVDSSISTQLPEKMPDRVKTEIQEYLRPPGDDESDHEWREHKFGKDEEGCVSASMRTRLGLSIDHRYSWKVERLGVTARYLIKPKDTI